MKTKSEIYELLIIICDFYNAYREVLGYSHDKTKSKIIDMYDDLHEWLYNNKIGLTTSDVESRHIKGRDR